MKNCEHNVLPDIVHYGLERYPKRVAYRFKERELTYEQLAFSAYQLAQLLIQEGLQKEDRVGILAERSLESFIAAYGIMIAGGVFVPLDPENSLPRQQAIIGDCGIQSIITTPAQKRKVKGLLTALPDQVLWVGGAPSWKDLFGEHERFYTWVDLEEWPKVKPDIALEPNQLAYLMYSSGSTGIPKGIMHTHASGLSYAHWSSKLYAVRPEDRFASHAALHFDISTFAYFTAPLSGCTTVIIPDSLTKLPFSLGEFILREKISLWYSVPLALIQLLEQFPHDELRKCSLRWVLYGGEPFAPHHLRQLMAIWPEAVFSNVYGPAEVNQCTYYNFSTLEDSAESVPLGEVWFEADYLLENKEEGWRSKIGEGELLISAPTRMRGYWNQPQKTAQSLYEDESGMVFYRTGDRVKREAEGPLYFLGRMDRQIKRRGYRIDLAEIESLISQYSGIQETAIYRDKSDENEPIIAVVRALNEDSFDAEEIRSYCKEKLPSYAVPEKIVQVENFPRTSSGKIIRSRLHEVI